ncbi:MAG: hypothetical protein M3509_13210, partial [Chloroflexota bacterium]|nr:hypothetical protein [Chloroflexota bacterium]
MSRKPVTPSMLIVLAVLFASVWGSLAAPAALVATAQGATPAAGVQMTREVPLLDAAGAEIGVATVSEGDGGVMLSLQEEGLEPGEHAWHLHAMG